MGVGSLRVDFRGRGASGGPTAECGIATMTEDALAGLAFVRSSFPGRRAVVLGICSGAKVAIGTTVADNQIAGLALWSAEALGDLREGSTNTRKTASALATYARKLARPATWKKLLTGKVDTKSVRNAVLSHETRSEEEAIRENDILQHFRGFRKPVLFVYGGNDPDTELAGRNYAQFCRDNKIPHQSHVIPEANHSFYSLDWERQVLDLTCQWLGGLARTT
jgi:pimeloyl-ACP methyl ester carboxylesterase